MKAERKRLDAVAAAFELRVRTMAPGPAKLTTGETRRRLLYLTLKARLGHGPTDAEVATALEEGGLTAYLPGAAFYEIQAIAAERAGDFATARRWRRVGVGIVAFRISLDGGPGSTSRLDHRLDGEEEPHL